MAWTTDHLGLTPMAYIPDDQVERIISRVMSHDGPLYAAVLRREDVPDAPPAPSLLVLTHGPWRIVDGAFCLTSRRVAHQQQAVSKGEAARLVRLWMYARYPADVACSPQWSGDLPASLPGDALPPRPRTKRRA